MMPQPLDDARDKPLDEARDRPAETSRRIKQLEVMVADVIVEAPDTTTLVLFTGNDRLEIGRAHV